MKKRFSKMILVAALIFVGLIIYNQVQLFMINKDVVLSNPPITKGRTIENYLKKQLSPTEWEAITILENRIEQFQGGVIEFEKELTEEEYTRIVSYLIYEEPNYFYATIIALDSDDTLIAQEKNCKVKKMWLYLSCSRFKEDMMKIEKGRVMNVTECEKALAINDEEEVETVKRKLEKTENMLAEVIADMPIGIGQKEAVVYFAEWIHTNVFYDQETFQEYSGSNYKSEELFRLYFTPSSTVCVLDGKAMCVGFAKTLVYLCNQVGIESYVIFGGNGTHAMSAIMIDNTTTYVDLSSSIGYKNGKARFMSEEVMKNIMKPSPYFIYE